MSVNSGIHIIEELEKSRATARITIINEGDGDGELHYTTHLIEKLSLEK